MNLLKSLCVVTLWCAVACTLIATEATENTESVEIKVLDNYEPIVYEDNVVFHEPQVMRVTCYAYTGSPTASGKMPKEGRTIAGKRDWMGYAAVLYQVNEDGSIGDYIDTLEFDDTGYGMATEYGGTIELGQSVDVYRDTIDGCYEWISKYGDYCYVQIIPSEG